MSHVQLSSSALERLVARRTFPRPSVCRNLFGPVGREERSREMKAKLREIIERDQQRWNFNFETNTPMDGVYEWEEVPADKTPAFYQETVKRIPSSDPAVPESPVIHAPERLTVPESSTSAPSPAEVDQENRVDTLNSGTQTPRVRRKRTAAPTHINACITDFFVKRKRVGDRKSTDSVSSCHLSEQSP